MSICPSCSQENPDIARYCLHCGAALGASAHREERRVVSVLFVDIVGFTSRAEQLDPEDVRAFLTPYYERVRREIEGHGGRIEKFVGDAVLGIFGAPIAHGDDAERAVRTALAIRDTLGEMNVVDQQLDLQARLAVNTGEVIVDLDARPEAGDSMIVGDVVNTAARLQSAAPVNGVLVGRETYGATRTVVQYEPAPPVIAKGKALPVEAWLAVAAEAPAGQRALSEAPLVGRGRELELLARLWRQVCEERRPHLVTVIGPAGIGKSRLAEEFAHFVAQHGGRPLRGRSAPYGDSSAYGAFAQQVKQIAEIFDNETADVVREKLRRVASDAELTENLALFLGFETERAVDRESLFFAARQLVESVARNQPTLLVFEDIHWADTSLLDLIEVLASRTENARLLILALTRPELYADRPAWGGGLLSATAVSLEPLAAGEALELASQLLGPTGVGDYAAHLAATAEGNPFFIEELAAVVAERGAGDAEDLPTTIRSILEARLDALEPDERAVLLDASVAGKVFWRGLLEKLQHRSVGIAELLGALEARGFIRQRGRLADPGRAAVLVQARAHPPGRVRVGAAGAAARATRGRGAVSRRGDDGDRCVGGDPRVSLARGRRHRPCGDVLHSCRRSRRAGLGEGARGRALQRGLPAATGRRRAAAQPRSQARGRLPGAVPRAGRGEPRASGRAVVL